MTLLNTVAVSIALTLSAVSVQASEVSLMLGSVGSNIGNTNDNYDLSLQNPTFFTTYEFDIAQAAVYENDDGTDYANAQMLSEIHDVSEQVYLNYVCSTVNEIDTLATCKREKQPDAVSYTEASDFIGIEYNQIQVATFTNPYNERSFLVAYNWNILTLENDSLYGKINLATGVVTGYTDSQMEFLSIGNLTAYVAPSIAIGYKVTSDVSIGLDYTITPVRGGTVSTAAARITYSF